MKEEIKGLYLAVILSVAVIFTINVMYPKPAKEVAPAATEEMVVKAGEDAAFDTAKVEEKEDQVAVVLDHDMVIEQDSRVSFENDVISGSIRTRGARIDNLFLKKYNNTLDKESGFVEILAPGKTKAAQFVDSGFISADRNILVPNDDTPWRIKSNEDLTAGKKVVFEWNNGQGLVFRKEISLDEKYMFDINMSVENNSGKTVELYPYGLIHKNKIQEDVTSNVVHLGAISVTNRVLKEYKYDKLSETKELDATQGGWAGFTDRYWLTSLILNNQANNKIKFSSVGKDKFQADFVGDMISVESGKLSSYDFKLFSGAKEIKVIDDYKSKFNIVNFDKSIDFGWYYFLTKPFFYILDFLYGVIGNMGWAILIFAALLRGLMYPVASKTYANMSKMKKLQPKIAHIQELYKEDKMKLQQETMALYKREKVNPASGCLPMFIQIPVFFSLYKVLNFAIEIRHAPFVGWIKDLSAPDPMILSRILHIPLPSFLDIGVWPIMMGITMYIQQKLNPTPTNKDQARMFALMPLIFTFVLGRFASGLIIYWTLSNILSILQQKLIMKKHGV